MSCQDEKGERRISLDFSYLFSISKKKKEKEKKSKEKKRKEKKDRKIGDTKFSSSCRYEYHGYLF